MTEIEKKQNAEIGKRIQKRRDKIGMKQEVLAGYFGFNRSHISKLENGERTISIDILKTMAEKLDVSADYLLGLSNCESRNEDYKMICECTGLNDTSVKVLEELNFLYGGKYLISTLNFLISQEILPPNEEFFEEKYRQIENSKISEKEKKNKIRQVKNIYDRMYQRWKEKDCQPILSSIEDYYTTKIENKNLCLDFFGNIQKEEDYTNELNKLSIKKKVPYQKLFEKICLDNITENLKSSKQKFLKGADKK